MPSLNVAVIGVGLVGGEFISQLLAVRQSPFRLVSVTSSKKCYYSPNGISTDWKQLLQESSAKPDLPRLLTELLVQAPPGQPLRAAVIDNTASESVATFYPEFLKAGIHVVTPNKKGWSGDLSLWQKIELATKEGESKILGEATVGAGLPIIGTLKNLVATGDKVRDDLSPIIWSAKMSSQDPKN